MPEIRLRVKRLQRLRKNIADTSGGGRFQIVDQGGDRECRGDLRQKRHVIRFPAEFQQSASPILKDFAKGPLQIVEKFRSEGLSPVLCDKNDMQRERIDGMRARLVGLIFPVAKGSILPC